MQDLHALPVLAISIFGIVSTSGGRIGIALPSGFIADRYLGGASAVSRGLIWRCGVGGFDGCRDPKRRRRLVSYGPDDLVVAVVLFYARTVFRTLRRNGLAAKVFRLGHRRGRLYDLPSSFAYLLWGFILDSYPGTLGYGLMFGILSAMALFSAAVAHRLHRRIVSGTAQRINQRISALDTELGLNGEEKTLSELVDAKGR